MKRLLVIIYFLYISSFINAQWSSQALPIEPSINLYAVKLVSSTVGWAVGYGGIILKTTDGGINWTLQRSDPTQVLFGVAFTDANTGTVVGSGGTILRTTDGGTTWTPQTSTTTRPLYAVSFTSANNGNVVGQSGMYIRTTNGGTTWTQKNGGTGLSLFAVAFTSSTTGTVVGNDEYTTETDGIILKTTNATNLTPIWITQSNYTQKLYGISFINPTTGTAVGNYGTILRTTDGGTTWTPQTSGTTKDLRAVSFFDLNNGTVVGNGIILRTNDGGAHWTEQTGGATAGLLGVSFADAENGIAVGYSGTLLRTTTGSTLPVEMNSFICSPAGSGVLLQWQTATEINNYGFEVERSSIPHSALRTLHFSDWETIGFVAGYGNSNSPHEYSFTHNNPPSGNLSYRLKQIDNDGAFKYYDAVSIMIDAPKEFALMQNSPNPFNPTTTIKFQMPVNLFVTISVYDMIGREVTTLLNEEKPAGSHIVYWNGRDRSGSMVSSGVYLYKLTAGSYTETRKMNFMK